jgi:hypothetical protein
MTVHPAEAHMAYATALANTGTERRLQASASFA